MPSRTTTNCLSLMGIIMTSTDTPAHYIFLPGYGGNKDSSAGTKYVDPNKYCAFCCLNSTTITQGMQAQIIKAVLSQALLFMSKDQFEHWALAIMVLFARLWRRQGSIAI